MLCLRHAHATPNAFDIDLIRNLSDQGIKQAEGIVFPTTIDFVISSPAVRAMETAQLATGFHPKEIMPLLYAPILLPEMDAMYAQHGESVRGYYNDARIANTMLLAKQTAALIKEIGNTNTLIVAHGGILNFVAYELYGIEAVLDIDLGTAKGFWINEEKKVIEF